MRVRLPGGQRNVLMFAFVALGAFVVTLYMSPDKPEATREVATEMTPPPLGGAAPASPGALPPTEPADDPTEAARASHLRTYAIPLVELQGLPPDVEPGARIELWVAWEPPVTEKRRVQKLFGGARVGRVIPPTVAEAPITIELLVPVKEFPELLFADRYGSLSAASSPR